MIVCSLREIQTHFVRLFQIYFSCHPIFKWDNNKLQTKINVMETFSEKNTTWPAVIFSADWNGNLWIPSYNDGGNAFIGNIYDVSDLTNPIKLKKISSPTSFYVNITCKHTNKFELETLVDEICSGFCLYGGYVLKDLGIIIKNGTCYPMTEEKYLNLNLYSFLIKLEIQTEFSANIKVSGQVLEDMQKYIETVYSRTDKSDAVTKDSLENEVEEPVEELLEEGGN